MEILMPALHGQAVEPYDFYRRRDPYAPWLRINMVSTVDGRATDAEGLSGGLGGEGDRAAFRAQRALADAVLVGAGTVRAEGYGPHRLHASVAQRRRDEGRSRPAAIVVVSGSLALDPDTPLFAEAVVPTVILTSAAAPRAAFTRMARVADIVVAGQGPIDLRDGIVELRRRGYAHILCEGGPTLNAALLSAGLGDELCLTVAPRIAAVAGFGIVAAGERSAGAMLTLDGVAIDGHELFLRYLIQRPDGLRASAP